MIEPKVFDFLRDLADNNNKDWMDDNRARFDTVKDHLHEVGDAIFKELAKIDDRIDDAELTGSDALMPLPHDTRFHDHDDTYKTGFTFSFCAAGGDAANHKKHAAYWLHIEPSNCFAGGGTVMTTNDALGAIRDAIADDWDTFEGILKRDKMSDTFPDGITTKESLKTSPQGIDEDHPGIEILRMKDFRLRHDLTHADLKGDDGKKKVMDVFKTVEPVVTFMNDAIKKNG